MNIHPDEHFDEPAPSVERLEVIRSTFRRGRGCCEKSRVRFVTAYYDAVGVLLFEIDPANEEVK